MTGLVWANVGLQQFHLPFGAASNRSIDLEFSLVFESVSKTSVEALDDGECSEKAT